MQSFITESVEDAGDTWELADDLLINIFHLGTSNRDDPEAVESVRVGAPRDMAGLLGEPKLFV